jgi:hypothetical protein
MTIPRSDLRTAIVVDLTCKLYDETGDIIAAMSVLARCVSLSVLDRVLLHPQNRRSN